LPGKACGAALEGIWKAKRVVRPVRHAQR
jgi:hypothetical protein